MIDLIGYIGLLVLLVSLSKENIESLRKWGLFSACIMCLQAILLGVSSLIVINAFIIGLHSYKLLKGFKKL